MRHGMQYAALPFRIDGDGSVQILLVTSRETRRWVLPKGWPIKHLRPSRVAEREAYEEAGLIGRVVGEQAIGSYGYDKRLPNARQRCQVWVFALRVDHQIDDWPEKPQRETKWFGTEDAANLVEERDLRSIIRSFPLTAQCEVGQRL